MWAFVFVCIRVCLSVFCQECGYVFLFVRVFSVCFCCICMIDDVCVFGCACSCVIVYESMKVFSFMYVCCVLRDIYIFL